MIDNVIIDCVIERVFLADTKQRGRENIDCHLILVMLHQFQALQQTVIPTKCVPTILSFHLCHSLHVSAERRILFMMKLAVQFNNV